jgi:membrane-associated phospholipid phosphatase
MSGTLDNSANNKIPTIQKTDWRGFWVSLLIGNIILLSWLYPPIREYWDAADRAVFFFLNGSIATPSTWSAMWALLNSRVMDLAPLILLLPFLLVPDLLIKRDQRIHACFHLLILLLILLVIRTIFEDAVEALKWRGKSPSLTLQPVYLLSEMYPSLDPKDMSKGSFPGDHAGVLMAVACFLLLHRMNALALIVTIIFIMPRMVSGAHWFSDVAVGGVFIASMTMALGFFTALPRKWADKLTQSFYHHQLMPRWLK